MDFEPGNEVWSVSGTASFNQRSQEDGSVGRPQSLQSCPAPVSATRASANGARWGHRLGAGTVEGFGQLPPWTKVLVDMEWKFMLMVTLIPHDEIERERQEEKMMWFQKMGKKIEITSEEQSRKEDERESLEKQAARSNKDLEIDDADRKSVV